MTTIETVTFATVAEHTVFINLDIVCWTGGQTLQPEDLGLDSAHLPPDTLVQLGTKKLVDPAALAVFTTTRAAARRACLAVGTRFLGGFIVPEPGAAALLACLDRLAATFNAAREGFLTRLERLIEDWVRQNPAWAAVIRGAAVSRERVARRLAFAVQAVKLAVPAGGVQPGLARATQGLAGTLLHEVATLAHATLHDSFHGKDGVSRRALRPVKAIQAKLDGLAFLDPCVRPLAEHIGRTLAALPAQGPLAGSALHTVLGLLTILEDPERARRHGAWLRQQDAGATAAVFTAPPNRVEGAVETAPGVLPPDPVAPLTDDAVTTAVTEVAAPAAAAWFF